MNKTISSNPVRLIAFFLTAIILACTFGFTVDGWQDLSGDNSDNDKPSNDTQVDGENSNSQDTPSEDTPTNTPEVYIPEFTNKITGLEISEEEAKSQKIALIIDGNLPLYGISSADMLCEIPIENEEFRYLAFIPKNNGLWKIGSIAPTRGYISNIVKFFGAAILSYGSDDMIDYPKCDTTGQHIDLSINKGYHYTENPRGIYTNQDLLLGAISDSKIALNQNADSPLPFVHREFGQDNLCYTENHAESVVIESGEYKREFRFDAESKTYSVYKNGEAIKDALTEELAVFMNCFILFADSVTYDRTEVNQMVMDTIGSGSGYYITNGSYTEIKWSAASGGIMTFYSQSGEKLTVNRGKIYLSFVKSSLSDAISFQ